jgi:hypothetical protein
MVSQRGVCRTERAHGKMGGQSERRGRTDFITTLTRAVLVKLDHGCDWTEPPRFAKHTSEHVCEGRPRDD